MIGTVADPPMILVLGGGPAGAAAAGTLSRLGHGVRLITRPALSDGPRLAVSIPPSGGKLLDVLGVSEAVEAAGFLRTSGNTVWWGDDRVRVTPFAAGERGWQVEVEALSHVLRDAASRAGVAIEYRSLGPRALASAVDPRPCFVLDCTGRAGLLARSFGTRQPEPELRSVALVGVWQYRGGWPVPDDTHTLIESYADGWAWSVPVAPGSRHVAVMVDPRVSALARGRAAEIYRAELTKAPRFRAMLSGATLSAGPWGWDASMYGSSRYTFEDTLLVGDAGSFVDPLSSAGVRKALVSGWTAAIAVHTSLTRPAMRAAALAFFEAREQRMYAELKRLARHHLSSAAAGHDAAFWDERHFTSDGDDTMTEGSVPGDEVRVREAFERIRHAPMVRLRAGVLRIEPCPAMRGHEIVLEPRIVTSRSPEGVRFVGSVDVFRLVELAPGYTAVPAMFEAYCRDVEKVALPAFLAALATAVAYGWLVGALSGPTEGEPHAEST